MGIREDAMAADSQRQAEGDALAKQVIARAHERLKENFDKWATGLGVSDRATFTITREDVVDFPEKGCFLYFDTTIDDLDLEGKIFSGGDDSFVVTIKGDSDKWIMSLTDIADWYKHPVKGEYAQGLL